jgi:hypothetical protein
MKKGKYDYKSGNILIRPTDENDIWNCKWDVFLIDKDTTNIGWASFEGNKEKGTVPVNIELQPLYRGRGNGTNVLKMMREFAFLHSNIYEVEAFADKDDSAFIHALERSGFVYREGHSIEGQGKERYSVTKPQTTWLGVYIAIGVVAGVILGIVISNVWAGMIIALLLAVALGSYMDSSERKRRRDVTGQDMKLYKKDRNKKR